MSGVDSAVTYVVSGFDACPYYHKAVATVAAGEKAHPDKVKLSKKVFPRDEYHVFRAATLEKLGKDKNSHTTCPLVFTVDSNETPQTFIGGCDATIAYFAKNFA